MFFFHINFLIYRVRDWVYQRSFTFSSQEGSLFGLLFRAFIHSPLLFKGSLVNPRLRASNEHIPIVRIPGAQDQWVHFLFFIVRVAQA
jgi:hypothetical protein